MADLNIAELASHRPRQAVAIARQDRVVQINMRSVLAERRQCQAGDVLKAGMINRGLADPLGRLCFAAWQLFANDGGLCLGGGQRLA